MFDRSARGQWHGDSAAQRRTCLHSPTAARFAGAVDPSNTCRDRNEADPLALLPNGGSRQIGPCRAGNKARTANVRTDLSNSIHRLMVVQSISSMIIEAASRGPRARDHLIFIFSSHLSLSASMPARPGVLGCRSSSFAWISLRICLPIIGGQWPATRRGPPMPKPRHDVQPNSTVM